MASSQQNINWCRNMRPTLSMICLVNRIQTIPSSLPLWMVSLYCGLLPRNQWVINIKFKEIQNGIFKSNRKWEFTSWSKIIVTQILNTSLFFAIILEESQNFDVSHLKTPLVKFYHKTLLNSSNAQFHENSQRSRKKLRLELKKSKEALNGALD